MRVWSACLTMAAGLFGALGVAAAAYAAHGHGGPDLAIASPFLLVHAAAIAGLSTSRAIDHPAYAIAATVLAIGVALFCGDLGVLALRGTSPIPIAAPIGGSIMILGWLWIGLAAVSALRKPMLRFSSAAEHPLDNPAGARHSGGKQGKLR
jgi:uncharacterized membrane protein YgdD (TMEM256/DUF423 family)